MSDPFTELPRRARHALTFSLLVRSGTLKPAYRFPQSGVAAWDYDPDADAPEVDLSSKHLLRLLIMLIKEDHLWPFVLEDSEWMELFGQERFGLIPIADHHNLSNDEFDLLAEGRVPFGEAIGELNRVLQGGG